MQAKHMGRILPIDSTSIDETTSHARTGRPSIVLNCSERKQRIDCTPLRRKNSWFKMLVSFARRAVRWRAFQTSRFASMMGTRFHNQTISRLSSRLIGLRRSFSDNAWEQHQDEDGNDYWFNTETGDDTAKCLNCYIMIACNTAKS